MPIIKSSARQKYHCQMFLKIPKQSYPVSFRGKTLLRIFVMTFLNFSNMRTNLRILNEIKPKELPKFTRAGYVAKLFFSETRHFRPIRQYRPTSVVFDLN